jgi:hypothetical protein
MSKLPNFIVIGGVRCGTTSLHYYLGLHPEISVSREKELDFFIEQRNWRKGPEWYKAQFHTTAGVKAWGECSPNYTVFPHWAGVPEKMHALLPDARLIYILRDPLERRLSHYLNALDLDVAPADINAAVSDFETSRFVLASRQCFQLEQFLKYYPLSRILLLTHEDLAKKRRETLGTIFRFLGVNDSFGDARFSRMLNGSETKRSRNWMGRLFLKGIRLRPGRMIPPSIGLPLRNLVLAPFSRKMEPPRLDAELRARLLELFREDTGHLRRLTGLPLANWCV